VNLEETMSECGRLGLKLMITEDFNLAISPKKVLKPKLRKAIRENKGELVCELMWLSYIDWLDGPTQLPPASPRMKEAYGDPHSFYDALMEYDAVRENYELVQSINRHEGALIMSNHGLVVVSKEGEI
jgi:hypothetical protein